MRRMSTWQGRPAEEVLSQLRSPHGPTVTQRCPGPGPLRLATKRKKAAEEDAVATWRPQL